MIRHALLLVGLVLALLVGQATDALATALYDAQVSSAFTVTGFFDGAGAPISKPTDLLIEGDAEVFRLFELALGTASADKLTSVDVFGSAPPNLGVGEGVALEAAASGSASAPPVSSAESAARTDALVFFENLSAAATYQVAFELTTSWRVMASADLPAIEAAGAEVEILLQSLSGGTLLDIFEFSDTTLGGGSLSDSTVLASVLVLEAGGSDELGLISDATGYASSVPEPSSFVLLGSGLVGLLARRPELLRRRGHLD